MFVSLINKHNVNIKQCYYLLVCSTKTAGYLKFELKASGGNKTEQSK